MTISKTSPVSATLAAAVAAATLSATPAAAHPHVFVGTKTTLVFENGAFTGLRYTWLFDEMYTVSAIEGLDKNNDGKLDPAELAELTKVNIEGLKEFDYFTTARLAGEPVTFGDAKDYAMEVVEVDQTPGPQLVAGPVTTPVPGTQQSTAQESKGVWSRFTGWVSGLFARSKSPSAPGSPPSNMGGDAKPGDKSKVLALHMTLPLKAPVTPDKLTASSNGFQYVLNDSQMYIWFEPMPKDGITLSPGAPESCRYAASEPEQDEEQKKLAEAFGRVGSMAVSTPGKAITLTCGTK